MRKGCGSTPSRIGADWQISKSFTCPNYSSITASQRVQRRLDRLLAQIKQAMDELEWATVKDCAQAVLALDAESSDGVSAPNAIDHNPDVRAMHASPLHQDLHALDSLAGGVFVGRQGEMGELKARLQDALSRRGRLVTMVGEPGIGTPRRPWSKPELSLQCRGGSLGS